MKKMISNIVFTKNRPLQLDAYLESLYRYFDRELIQTYIIYRVERFEEEYERLFRKYPTSIVTRESNLHRDFLQILSQISTRYILFGVDDVVYFDSVDFEIINDTFSRFPREIFGFSLRFDKDSVEAGHDHIDKTIVAGQTVYSLDWTQGQTPKTRYPFELCATVYRTTLVRKIIDSTMNNNLLAKRLFSPGSILIKSLSRIISARRILKSLGYFFSPNTLESWTCRWCQNHGNQLPGFFYFQKLCASAIQVNMVNTTTANEFYSCGEYSIEALANKYKQGYRFDIDYIARNRPIDTHCGPEYFKLIRDKAVCNTPDKKG